MVPDQKKFLFASILSVIGIYFMAESLAFGLIAILYRLPSSLIVAFLLSQVLFHSLLAILLILGSNFFYNTKTGIHLNKVNLANKITLLRITMLPLIFFLILSTQNFPVGRLLISVLAVTFLTDLFDGRISRMHNEVTQIGRILDSVSDYALLFVVALAYCLFSLLPWWLFFIFIIRLAFQALSMTVIFLIKKRLEPQTTILGKIAVATMMILLALETLRLLNLQVNFIILQYLEFLAGCIIIVSLFDKAFYLYKSLRKNEFPREDP